MKYITKLLTKVIKAPMHIEGQQNKIILIIFKEMIMKILLGQDFPTFVSSAEGYKVVIN